MDKEYEKNYPAVLKQAKAFKSAAFAQFAHMVVGQKCENSSSWDHSEVVTRKSFNDFMSFFLGSDSQVNKLWLDVFQMIENNKLIKDWTTVFKDGNEVRKPVFAVSFVLFNIIFCRSVEGETIPTLYIALDFFLL